MGSVWRARRYCAGMVLSVAPGCRVTVHFGGVRIVNFLKRITEAPGCERSLSRCRCMGQRVPGRLDCQPTPVYRRLASGSSHERWSPSQSPRGSDADFPTGGELIGRAVDHSVPVGASSPARRRLGASVPLSTCSRLVQRCDSDSPYWRLRRPQIQIRALHFGLMVTGRASLARLTSPVWKGSADLTPVFCISKRPLSYQTCVQSWS